MSTISRIFGRTGKILTATAIATWLAAGLAAAPASAAPLPKAKLTITPVSSTQYKVSIVGVYPMTQADAQGYINNMGPNGGMRFNIRGTTSTKRFRGSPSAFTVSPRTTVRPMLPCTARRRGCATPAPSS
jgi:hypothetical protein